MIEIIITISTFSSMVMLFKYFEKINVNNLQAISANYFTAGILSIIFLPNTFEFDKINYSNTTLFFVLAFIVVIVVSKLTYTKKEKNSNRDSGTQIQSGSYGIS